MATFRRGICECWERQLTTPMASMNSIGNMDANQFFTYILIKWLLPFTFGFICSYLIYQLLRLLGLSLKQLWIDHRINRATHARRVEISRRLQGNTTSLPPRRIAPSAPLPTPDSTLPLRLGQWPSPSDLWVMGGQNHAQPTSSDHDRAEKGQKAGSGKKGNGEKGKEDTKKCRLDGTCTICQVEMTSLERTHCGHVFHSHCLGRWLMSGEKKSCPMCRGEISSGDVGEHLTVGTSASSIL